MLLIKIEDDWGTAASVNVVLTKTRYPRAPSNGVGAPSHDDLHNAHARCLVDYTQWFFTLFMLFMFLILSMLLMFFMFFICLIFFIGAGC